MPGYANRLVTRTYPDLSEPDDQVHIVLRNPKTVPIDDLIPDVNDAGGVIPESEMRQATYEVIARLVVGGHLYDATAVGDDQPLLDYPLTPKTVAALPMDIINDLAKLISEVTNPS